MADMRRRTPEPPPRPPKIEIKPGMAQELLRELAPLLAEEGIDAGNIDVPDLQTLQAAMNRAVAAQHDPLHARRPRPRPGRHHAAPGDRGRCRRRHGPGRRDPGQVEPESPGDTAPTVAGCIGVALGLLDDWLTGGSRQAPHGLGQHVRLPAGHWTGERAATDILVLARKARAFASLDTLIARQGGMHVLYGSALTLAATIQAWAAHTDTTVSHLARTAVR